MLGLGNKDSQERCTGLYCEVSSHQVKVGESQQRVARGAAGDRAMNNWFSALMAVAVFQPSGYHALPDTTPHSALSAQGNWSHSARMSPSCQANLPLLPRIT